MPLYKKELTDFANKFIKILNENGLNTNVCDKNFRDYLLQMPVTVSDTRQNIGTLSLYYKPTKKTYSLSTKDIKDATSTDIINKCWDEANGFETFKEDSGIYEVFVDGSFIDGKTGYGAVIFLGDKNIKEFCGSLEDTSTRQFGGEIYSVMQVIKWCEENNIKKIRINYDYLGIEYFATGKWEPKSSLAVDYVEVIAATKTEILWRKIDSHTGNKKNDIADSLAKQGARS